MTELGEVILVETEVTIRTFRIRAVDVGDAISVLDAVRGNSNVPNGEAAMAALKARVVRVRTNTKTLYAGEKAKGPSDG